VRAFRGDTMYRDMDEADEEFWLRILVNERAAVVWELSEELFALSDPASRERRLPRSAFRPTRR
jgi:hypothetical protein